MSGDIATAALTRTLIAMVKRRSRQAVLPSICKHRSRATGNTIHQENGDRPMDAQDLGGHTDIRTPQLLNQKQPRVARAEGKRVRL